MASFNQESRAGTQREEAPLQGKYGGISPKKALINKDHERAYFDSADWVLGKVANYSSTQLVAAQRPRVSNRGRYTHMSELTPPPLVGVCSSKA
uniref:cAMP-regulated phosphoprotein 19-related protein n=1 Tax=Zea mays TaxID=4577 RepID=A0A804UFX7_MAIZE